MEKPKYYRTILKVYLMWSNKFKCYVLGIKLIKKKTLTNGCKAIFIRIDDRTP